MPNTIETRRLTLRAWDDTHRAAFARMHADPEVMADLGGPLNRTESDAKFDRYWVSQHEQVISRWTVENHAGLFLGYAGVMWRRSKAHPLGAHYEIGWRFTRSSWGNGFASESARAALGHATGEIGLTDIVSYTSSDNLRSQAVMNRIGLVRQPSRDFDVPAAHGRNWHGLVWATEACAPATAGR